MILSPTAVDGLGAPGAQGAWTKLPRHFPSVDDPAIWAVGRIAGRHVPGETNPADIFTKILGKQTFEKHRKTVLNVSPPDHSVGA